MFAKAAPTSARSTSESCVGRGRLLVDSAPTEITACSPMASWSCARRRCLGPRRHFLPDCLHLAPFRCRSLFRTGALSCRRSNHCTKKSCRRNPGSSRRRVSSAWTACRRTHSFLASMSWSVRTAPLGTTRRGATCARSRPNWFRLLRADVLLSIVIHIEWFYHSLRD